MATLARIRVALTGFTGSPGVCTYYFLDTATAVDSLHTLWTSYALSMPDEVRVQVESIGDTIDGATGAVNGTWVASPVAVITGAGAGNYAAPAGATVTWLTAGIVHGHHVRGRSFIVPLSGDSFAGDGSLQDAFVSTQSAASAAFILAQSASFMVWSRPFPGTPAVPGRPANPARIGSNHLVVGTRIRDKAAVLRSRRD